MRSTFFIEQQMVAGVRVGHPPSSIVYAVVDNSLIEKGRFSGTTTAPRAIRGDTGRPLEAGEKSSNATYRDGDYSVAETHLLFRLLLRRLRSRQFVVERNQRQAFKWR